MDDNSINKEYLSKILSNVNDSFDAFYNIKMEINGIEQYFDFDSDIHIPTFAVNNKLIELNNEFIEHGINMFIKNRYVVDGIYAIFPGISQSFLGNAIFLDLIRLINECSTFIEEYYKVLKNPNGILKTWLIKTLYFLTDKSLFDIMYTDNDKDNLKENITKYREYNDKIFSYNLEDNVIFSIIYAFNKYELDAYQIAIIMEDDIVIDLEKLGLSHLIPKLKSEIIKNYEKDITSDMEIADDERHYYIPDFDRAKDIRNTVLSNMDRLYSSPDQNSFDMQTISLEYFKNDKREVPTRKLVNNLNK